MPVLTLEKKTASFASVSSAVSAARRRFHMPAWALAALVLAVGVTAFAAGRHKPAHHYVPYFGSMVMDTTTGKACYMKQPKNSDGVLEDSAFAIDGTPADAQAGPSFPVCGQE
jgi:hypothetical protein